MAGPLSDEQIIGPIWVTKYALTRGISRYERARQFNNGKFIAVGYMVFHKPDWHLTEAEANLRAIKMRDDKIESLRERIAKLEQMEFS